MLPPDLIEKVRKARELITDALYDVFSFVEFNDGPNGHQEVLKLFDRLCGAVAP
jgi:hypothetical protein